MTAKVDRGQETGSLQQVRRWFGDELDDTLEPLARTSANPSGATCLGGPRDLLREQSQDPGCTWDGTSNQLISADDRDRLRLDCVIAFDRIPDVGNPAFTGNLRPCRCVAAAVEQFGTTAKTRLSDHFGVSVRWSCRHRRGPRPTASVCSAEATQGCPESSASTAATSLPR